MKNCYHGQQIFQKNVENQRKNKTAKRRSKFSQGTRYLPLTMKILEVHETTRTNGHGLGMWIVNNTCTMSGGEIQKIGGEKGFEIEFTIGGKI